MPPHTPNSTRLSRASAPHCINTGQCRQMVAALRCAAPRTKSWSGSTSRQRAWVTQAIRASACSTSRRLVGVVMCIRFPSSSLHTPAPSTPRLHHISDGVLSPSHCSNNLGKETATRKTKNTLFWYARPYPVLRAFSWPNSAPNQRTHRPHVLCRSCRLQKQWGSSQDPPPWQECSSPA